MQKSVFPDGIYNKQVRTNIFTKKRKDVLMKGTEKQTRRSFTLIELLVVIAMIAITTNDCIIAK